MSKKKKRRPAKTGRDHPLRRAARYGAVAIVLIFAALCTAGGWYVRHPKEWIAERRSFATAPLEYLGNRCVFATDALGWTGHDAVYESDDPAPSGQVFFAGEPVRTAPPAPTDITVLRRGEFSVGWSPSLRHPAWVAYHVVPNRRFEAGKRPGFQRDREVPSSPPANAYTRTGYDRGHMVPNRAIVTRYGPEEQRRTFLMTNIAPQRPSLNRGPWREMEQRIADLWTDRYGELWVIAGAISGTDQHSRETLAGTSVDVPDRYFMLIAAQDADGVRALAVLFDHHQARSQDFPVHDIVTIEELERATGLEFFPDMPHYLKNALKRDRPTRLWPIRWFDLPKLIMIRFT